MFFEQEQHSPPASSEVLCPALKTQRNEDKASDRSSSQGQNAAFCRVFTWIFFPVGAVFVVELRHAVFSPGTLAIPSVLATRQITPGCGLGVSVCSSLR